MGNTGSAHNMHMENISSELNALYNSQQLRRAGKRQQQQHQLQWTHSLPHMMGATADGEMSAARPASVLAQIKVLPQLSERLKLRTTTNGAILHSGGTISGRREQQLKRGTQKPLAMQQRSRTFIDEPRADCDGNSAHQVPSSLSEFRRAQTLLHLDYSSTYRNNVSLIESSNNRSSKNNRSAVYNKKCSDLATEQKHRIKAPPLLPTAQAKAASPTLLSQSRSGAVSAQANDGVKLNKYNKKRKAPAVPLKTTTKSAIATKNSTAAAEAVASTTPILQPTPDMNVTAATKAIATITKTALSDTKTATKGLLAKTRLFRTNAAKSTNKPTNIQQQPQLSPYQQPPLRQMQQQHQSSMNAITRPNVASSKLTPYRREKSSDAIQVRQFSELPNKALTCSLNGGDTGKYKSATVPSNATTSGAPLQVSRSEEVGAAIISMTISQLNRTFYFGMGTASGKQDEAYPEVALTAPPAITKPPVKGEISSAAIAAETAASAAAADAISSYVLSMSPEAQAIVDNGLLVHVRPTLPRRQLDPPSFSPVTAWRMLVEEQKRLHKRTITNNVKSMYLPVVPTGNKIDLFPYMTVCDTNHTGVSALKEPPIQLHKVEAATTLLFLAQRSLAAQFAATWTPQQDLEDEEDDDNNDNNDNDEDNDGDHDDRAEGLEKTREDGKTDGYDVENGRGHRVDHKNQVDSADIAIATFSHRKCLETHHETATDTQKYGRTKKQTAASTKIANRSAAPAVSRMHVFSLSLPRDGRIAAHMENRHATAAGQRKDDTCDFSSLQKLKYKNHNNYKCCCMEVSAARNLLSDTDEQVAPIVADATSQCAVHSHSSANYRSDNWVLHKTKSTSSLAIASVARYPQHTLRKNTALADTLTCVEPNSLAYLTAGKHVMYLPGKAEHKNKGSDGHGAHATANKRSARIADANRNRVDESMEQQQAPLKQQQQKRQRRTRPVRESLQDADSVEKYRQMPSGGTSNVDKLQRFSFQSTVRLLEKCRLAEQLAKDAEIREEQRKSELEAMKRVEEDFQRKRASEKANIRNQLRLYFSGVDECSDSERQRKPQYMSLPVFRSKQGQELLYPHNQQPHDSNNNIACRNETDGANSPPTSSYVDAVGDGANQVAQSCKPLQRRHDFNCGESDLEPEVVANFKRNASLVKPYLQSIVK